jgi:TonB-linked SusC/RagA family outer membrane protein
MKKNKQQKCVCGWLKKAPVYVMLGLFLMFSGMVSASTVVDNAKHRVTGLVKTGANEALIGVSVVEKGTSNGRTTDVDGSFSIDVSEPNSVLTFSYVGFTTKDVPVNGQSSLVVILEELVTGLDEVIVVAYGTQKKSSVTGSIAVVKAEHLTTVTSPSVNTMLQGKVAGVQVVNTSGRPGDAAVIRIRGKSSLGSDSSVEPLWVIDGVISGTGAQLNPNEIESLSILKDATATALYGSRATNGVILVTTKRGRAGENTINASVKFGTATQHLAHFKLMNGPDLYDYTSAMPGALAQLPWLADKDQLLAHNTDWFDFATQTGFSQNYTLTHTFGTEKVRNFLSLDYYQEEGTVKGYEYERFSFRNNIDYTANSRLTVHIKIAGSYRDIDNRQHDLYSAMTYLPWDYPYNADGTVRTGKENGVSTFDDWHGRDASNYLYNVQYDWYKGKQLGANGTLGFDFKITDWLLFESNNNVGFRYHRAVSYVDPRSIGSESTGGQITNDNDLTTTKYTNQLLRLNKIFAEDHAVSAFLGYEYSDFLYESTNAVGQSIPIDAEVLNVAAKPYSTKGTKYENATQSVYFNANYTYNDRYNAQFSYRYDGSSKFGANNRYGSFWTVGAAWSVDRESFMKNATWVDLLKLRLSYGSIGNSSSLGNYSYLSVYSLSTNYAGIPASFPNVLGNTDLTWEKCYETNFAIDARLFNRLDFTAEYYIKNTSDLLYSRKLSSLTGYNSRYENVGAVRNTGIELSLSGDIIASKDVVWSAGVNFGYNTNKITALANENADQFPDDYSHRIFRVGEDRDIFYLPEWAGVDVYTGAPLWYAYDQSTGERKVVTNRADASYVLTGSSTPKFFGGVNMSVQYKGITLSAMGSFVAGNKIYHAARQFYDNDGAYPTYNTMDLASGPNGSWVRWQQPGDIATHPQAIAGGNNGSNEASTRFIEDGSYFRLNNVTLSYDLPEKWLRKINLKHIQLYLTGENLFTITKFSGADVEVGVGNSNGTYSTDLYPSVRRFSVGLNFSF